MPLMDNKGSRGQVRYPIARDIERVSNSIILFVATSCGARKREYCYEEGSFRGGEAIRKLIDTPKMKGRIKDRRKRIEELLPAWGDAQRGVDGARHWPWRQSTW